MIRPAQKVLRLTSRPAAELLHWRRYAHGFGRG